MTSFNFEKAAGMVDVSHGQGIPFGGIGTGYSVFGKYGFTRVNFNSAPDMEQTAAYPRGEHWRYDEKPGGVSPFAFVLREGFHSIALQQEPLDWLAGADVACDCRAFAYLPKGWFLMQCPGWAVHVMIEAFSPMIPHVLPDSSVPAQIFTVTLANLTGGRRSFHLGMACRETASADDGVAVVTDAEGAVALACGGGVADSNGVGVELVVEPHANASARFAVAWYYPRFSTPSPALPGVFQRYYTKRFRNAHEVARLALDSADKWSDAIDRWHASYDVPPCFQRLWFSSLSSVITSTMLSADPYFFEIESPHPWINTMDVSVYSSWLYLVNWPELEMMDINQYFAAMPMNGPDKGFVWHSLWNEGADYMEEPIFPARVYRDYLWNNDRAWLESAYERCVLAANRACRKGVYGRLLSSSHGNQSYDCWKMPGVSAFVNSAWIFSLYSIGKMADVLGRGAELDGLPIGEYFAQAVESFSALLWNGEGEYWNCFFRTPDAEPSGDAEASFLDQLFGLWLLLIDRQAAGVLPPDIARDALKYLYANNLVDDPARGFRGWANGMLPGSMPDMESGHHARTCWIGAQLNMGSLLGALGCERKSLDVFYSVEASLLGNHLAVGEWNQSVGADGKSRALPEEPGKDTPRFPPYPRYKCSWEYLIRMLGLTLDGDSFYLNPFKSLNFKLTSIRLAGVDLTVSVETNWSKARVNGVAVELPLSLGRRNNSYFIEFYR